MKCFFGGGKRAEGWQAQRPTEWHGQRAGTVALRLTWVRRLFDHKASACRLQGVPADDGLAGLSACWEAQLLFPSPLLGKDVNAHENWALAAWSL